MARTAATLVERKKAGNLRTASGSGNLGLVLVGLRSQDQACPSAAFPALALPVLPGCISDRAVGNWYPTSPFPISLQSLCFSELLSSPCTFGTMLFSSV